MVNLIKNNIARLYLRNYGFASFAFLLIAWPNLIACKDKKHKKAAEETTVIAPADSAPKRHYDFSSPQAITLGEKLHEISGIAYISDHIILGENDEQGKIFSIDPLKPEDINYPSVKFGGKGDYEDIVVVGSTAYLLISDGEIVEVPEFSKSAEVTGTVIAQMGGKHNEFETLYYDKSVNGLIMVCKSCHHEKDQIRTAYRFDLSAKKFSDTAYFTISIPDIGKKLNETEPKFFPSAAAIHPLLGKLYILSSIGKLLVVTDQKEELKKFIN
ncbi:MAG: hypothetical protein QM764_18785 [Chitinophagaceae bacterium]